MSRRTYLTHCIGISLQRRVGWVVAAGLIGTVGAGVVDPVPTGLMMGAAALSGLSALGIAMNSYLRHSSDVEAQPWYTR
ncbi:hypothetical protein HNQ08_001616 [Deinococcus humi]|uniref:Uncharacterized protein n=1 Tax=Deinococcus humi TaxID=662880 RepID=A0A7W8NDL7_9DEIO|nr:hypothetical protein [Deinococcus humi]GGO28398.1 hypothetical protein GCM10008949_21000 [Deinococcus humi]